MSEKVVLVFPSILEKGKKSRRILIAEKKKAILESILQRVNLLFRKFGEKGVSFLVAGVMQIQPLFATSAEDCQ
jgi:hypothetical protein